MAKDPAVLFYTSDFLTGTALMSYEERGRYIYLLCLQHQMGGISQDHMKIICESYDVVKNKFDLGKDGLFRNKRMEEESLRRAKYSESRSKNKKGKNHMKIICESYEDHMETATETRVREKGVGKGEGIPRISEVEEFFVSSGFKIEVAQKAFRYYDEAGWKDSRGVQVRNWKQKMVSVWFTEDAKQTVPQIDKVKAKAAADDFHNSRLGPADRVHYPKDDDHVDE